MVGAAVVVVGAAVDVEGAAVVVTEAAVDVTGEGVVVVGATVVVAVHISMSGSSGPLKPLQVNSLLLKKVQTCLSES